MHFFYHFIAMLYLLWKKSERLSRYKTTRNRYRHFWQFDKKKGSNQHHVVDCCLLSFFSVSLCLSDNDR